MWLINTSALTLTEFVGENVPPYAVLSHRWSSSPQDEVSHKEFRKGLKKETTGYAKIVSVCRLAQRQNLNWLWADTCCIDKRSSAELSEAINSMFLWYQKARVCYAYLSDIENDGDWRVSEWWRRGWTLQELIAPREIIFYSRQWRQLGTKTALAREIETICKVPKSVLTVSGAYMNYCVAQRMSWAAGRRTTRAEDKAYCLLGLFQINLPLLYGEGARAFQRLQIEILQKYPDESVLAWKRPNSGGAHAVLAISPDDFGGSGHSQIMPSWPFKKQSELDLRRANPPRVTSWGIELRANARKLTPLRPGLSGPETDRSLWAVTLAIGLHGRIQELRCTLVLSPCGPAPLSYQRLECLYGEWTEVNNQLKDRYAIKSIEADILFYLKYDNDMTWLVVT